MAQYLLTVVEGTTVPLQFQLLQNGAPLNVAGTTITLLLTGSDRVPIQNGPVTIIDGLNGKVQYAPNPSDLSSLKSPYLARFKIVDVNGNAQYVPSGYRDEWNVVGA
jgi:baseplate upper protein BppU